MKQKKTGLFLCFCFIATFLARGQRMLTEAKLTYNLTPIPEKGQEDLASAFNNATRIVWLRGTLIRTDFYSPNSQQSVIYNAATGIATLLRVSGEEKYQWNLDSAQWKQYNQKWTATTLQETGETASIGGYDCQKVIATYGGGDSSSIFYTRQFFPIANGYEPMFEGLKGVPVQYEWIVGGLKLRYTLIAVQIGPVGSSRFEIPKNGYKIIEALQERPQ
jgi:hypothetical protein